ncbi:MAG: DUF4293 family protein [Bacteroidia bacterium]|nr:DUF4293 family protein [Bacteroidia bacterium]
MFLRIQSLYLSLTILLSLLFLNGSYLNFIDKSESVIKVTFAGIIRDTNGRGFELIEKLIPLSVIIVLIPALSLVIFLLFKYRKIQLWLALSEIVLCAGLIVMGFLYSCYVSAKYVTDIIFGIKMIIPVLMLIFAILAYRGIKKDDHLIKSYDRLR